MLFRWRHSASRAVAPPPLHGATVGAVGCPHSLLPTWILDSVRGLSSGLMSAQMALKTMGALMMQMRPSISG